MTHLIEYAKTVIEKYPSLKSDIHGLIDLCITEIEEGGSKEHEINLCWSDIEYLVKEHEAEILTKSING
jgi:hypothetical protein